MTTHSIYERHGIWIVLLGCGLLPFVGLLAKIALERNVNDVKDWLLRACRRQSKMQTVYRESRGRNHRP